MLALFLLLIGFLMSFKFKAIHLTANGNVLLEPVGHKQPIAKKTILVLNGKKAVEIFDTIASVDNPLYLAKPFADIEITGKILETGGKK